ncbi:universal stress protein [Pleurocapsales cyanobacterium LEGE 10410]|nr:universal stress protein [Pleurocapsales cyanobacterium LEGE 10410]
MSLFSKNRVLFPTDFSEQASAAQDLTLEFVGDPTHLYIVHVLAPLSPLEPGIVWEGMNNETRKHNVEKTFRTKFDRAEYAQVNFDVLFGKTSKQIVDYAKEKDIDLIVIPAHGQDNLEHFILGSVTERVVRLAHCPVYVWRSL